MGPLEVVADAIGRSPFLIGLCVALVLFAGGWILSADSEHE